VQGKKRKGIKKRNNNRKNCLLAFLSQIPVFNPSNKLKLAWDFLQLLITLLLFVLVPVRIAIANMTFEQLLSKPVLTTVIVLLFVDFFV
jgi:hypothetical protein